RLDPAMRLLLNNLDVLAAHDLKKLCRICRVNMEDLQEMIAEIRELNPKPGAEFDDFVIETVIADAVMKKLPKESGGGWGVELNPDTLPKLLINHRYYTEVKDGVRKQQDRDYLNARMAEAKWLLKTLDQRAQSILRWRRKSCGGRRAFLPMAWNISNRWCCAMSPQRWICMKARSAA